MESLEKKWYWERKIKVGRKREYFTLFHRFVLNNIFSVFTQNSHLHSHRLQWSRSMSSQFESPSFIFHSPTLPPARPNIVIIISFIFFSSLHTSLPTASSILYILSGLQAIDDRPPRRHIWLLPWSPQPLSNTLLPNPHLCINPHPSRFLPLPYSCVSPHLICNLYHSLFIGACRSETDLAKRTVSGSRALRSHHSWMTATPISTPILPLLSLWSVSSPYSHSNLPSPCFVYLSSNSRTSPTISHSIPTSRASSPSGLTTATKAWTLARSPFAVGAAILAHVVNSKMTMFYWSREGTMQILCGHRFHLSLFSQFHHVIFFLSFTTFSSFFLFLEYLFRFCLLLLLLQLILLIILFIPSF